MMRVRLKDIADALGVDKSTVSLALREHPRIPAATRKLIQEKAAEMGYAPDPALRRLAEQRWKNSAKSTPYSIALISWTNGDYPDQREIFLSSLREYAAVSGYGFEHIIVADFHDSSAAVRIMISRGVKGLIVMPSIDPDAWTNFPWEKFAAIQISAGTNRMIGLHTVRHDAFGTMLDAGRRVEQVSPASATIVHIKQSASSLTDERDRAAALLVMERWCDAGIRVIPPISITVGNQMGKELAAWLKRERPSVVLLPNSGLLWAISEYGVKIPDDIQVIALRRRGDAAFAGYERRMDVFSKRVIHQLDSLIRHDERGIPEVAESTVVPESWVLGPSFDSD